MEQLKELISTFEEEYDGATDELNKNRLKNAIILYSKSLFALCDMLIFLKYEKLPKNHSDRFRVLENNFPEIYSIVDRVWTNYRDSYSKSSNNRSVEEIKNAIKEISGFENSPKRIKEIINQ